MVTRILGVLCLAWLVQPPGAPAHTAAAAREQPRAAALYDGHWWMSVGEDERFGFLNGYLDCYRYEFMGPDRYTSFAVVYRTALTDFYAKGGATDRDASISDLLHRLRDTGPPPPIEPFSGHNAEPHGGNDGLVWRAMGAHVDAEFEQLGFVEGYLACHAALNHNKGGTFSKPAKEYVTAITTWYRFNISTGNFDSKRERVPVADVLFKFRD